MIIARLDKGLLKKEERPLARAVLMTRELLDEALSSPELTIAEPGDCWTFITASVPIKVRGQHYDLLAAWALLPEPEAVM